MKVTFIGTGEACDPVCLNTSLLVEAMYKKAVLLDCGFSVPHAYFRISDDPEQLAGVWISHFHGDHFFGTPLLYLRLHEMGREESLSVLGAEGLERKLRGAMELAYPGFMEKLNYPIRFVEMRPGETIEECGLQWEAAEIEHSGGALAVKIINGRKSIFYSGDGRATGRSRTLAAGCDMIVHEAFRVHGETDGHGTMTSCLALARESGCGKFAFVHIFRKEREDLIREIERRKKEFPGVQLLVPRPGGRGWLVWIAVLARTVLGDIFIWYLIQKPWQQWSHRVFFADSSWIDLH